MKRLNLKQLLRRRAETPAPEVPSAAGVMMRAQWYVAHVGGRGTLPAVELFGPGVDDLVQQLLDVLSDSIVDGDGRGQAWSEYVVAKHNLAAANDALTEADDRDVLEDALANAWDRLVPDLLASIRLPLAEARLVAEQLDEACGRVGLVTQ